MTRGRKPSAHDPARREEILRFAADVFIEYGYAGATMLEVARRANASKTTLYALFSSKAALFEELLMLRLREIPAGLNPEAALEEPDQYEFLRVSACRILGAVVRPSTIALYRTAIAEVRRFPELTAIMVKSRNYDGLTDYMAKCRDRGLMVFDDAETAATMFVSMATGEWINLMLIGALEGVPQDSIEAHAALAARMFLTAVAPGERERRQRSPS
jgi:AcrR family transcriptional regulator